MNKNTVIVNGTEYDAHTGLAIRKISTPLVKVAQPHTHAGVLHAHAQKSQTLSRQVVKRAPAVSTAQPITVHTKRSPQITKFAPHPVVTPKPALKTMDIGPMAHPLAVKVQVRTHTPSVVKPSQVLKQEAIAQAMAQVPSRQQAEKSHAKQRRNDKRRSTRTLSLASAGVALMLLAGYFTYLNMPSLSVRVAAAQAGINASYPAYHPDGYSISGPVAYTEGQVDMKFAANAGPQNFTLTQSKSSWDSTAVLDNYVRQKVGDKYDTYSDSGLTIYTYGSNATWVNGGILYTIDGTAPLTSDQIRRIATSM